MPKPCAFCAIVAGDAPAHEVHRDASTVAFLDVKPIFPGHVLLVPREHVTTLADLPPHQVPGFFALAQRLERAVETTMDAPGSLVLINNVVSQSVPHLHLHVVPRRPKDGLRFFLGPRHPYPDTNEADAVAERIGAALRAGPDDGRG
ncbi:HIT family protein [Actinomycetospora sp. NBRC 106378]|uniref:HIT family protein n=1 Tax=Actinomycetospora sp. NBRC 106378 TaxID=3032208 RepID=UPI0024A09EEE|nr:HIT family protein [Actinomycetospora sp. NBRC 106378]GLZ56106.1 hydrolase [Actinomycetospora sp. NBRC 106378]